jgi:hypothetical protein
MRTNEWISRRLTPDFKVRVEVKYRGRVQLPVHLKAYIITQQERDSLHNWAPEELYDPESPKVPWLSSAKPSSAAPDTCHLCCRGSTSQS